MSINYVRSGAHDNLRKNFFNVHMLTHTHVHTYTYTHIHMYIHVHVHVNSPFREESQN